MKYRIKFYGTVNFPHYYVYPVLGVWPFPLLGREPVYDSPSRIACERWIEDALFAASPEGQRQIRCNEIERELRKERWEAYKRSMEEQGFIYNIACHWFEHEDGRTIPCDFK